jgi:uncharacterized protein YgiM (DUF1202 family)
MILAHGGYKMNYTKFSKFEKQNKPTQAITNIKEEPESSTEFKKVVVANCECLNLRAKPSKDSPVVGILLKDARLLVEGINDGWAHVFIDTDNVIEGYVMAEYIE